MDSHLERHFPAPAQMSNIGALRLLHPPTRPIYPSTHAGQQGALSANARRVLADPAVALHVSAISTWEIAIKTRKGKLELPSAAEVWRQTFLNSFGVNEVPVTGA